MSSIVPSQPYVAPWRTQFNRYSTQILPMQAAGIARRVTIPASQWWRVGYATARYITSAAVGDRLMTFTILVPGASTALTIPSPVSQATGVDGLYTVSPNLGAYGNSAGPGIVVGVWGLPDMLWPAATVLEFQDVNNQAGDAFGANPTIAVEIYTEDYNTGDLVPLTVEQPVLA